MSGLSRPQHDSFEITDEIQSLTGRGSGGANRRRRLGGDTFADNVAGAARSKGVLLAGLVIVGAVYYFGKERGQNLRVSKPLPDVGESVAPVPATPTYSPTTGTDPPVPTYDPTKAGTSAPTPLPTFGNHSYIPDPNPYVDKFNTTEWQEFNKQQWEQRTQNSIEINEMYGSYCPDDPLVPKCPALNEERDIINKDWQELAKGPTLNCIETGGKEERCGVDNPWLNKTIWPLIRGPKCVILNNERKEKFPLPDELVPYFELGYDRNDPTKSTDAAPFDGGGPGSEESSLWFDANIVKDHFLKFEAMLEHYYEGLARPLLEKIVSPDTENPVYSQMLKRYSDQIARAILRRKQNGESDQGLLIGVLGDSVTAGQDNCYFDAWPEQFRRQMAPIFGSMGLKMDVRNTAKNGGWSLQPQMLCANDLLGVSNDEGLDFLFQTNPFVHHDDIDAEHMIRRALFGNVHTLISMTGAERFVEKYASAGLNGVTTNDIYKLQEFNMPERGYAYWFPDLDRAFWQMQGDGFCRLTTRAGSASVINRNWHWGPLLHQTYADGYSLLFSRAARQAIDDLSQGRMPPEPPSISDFERVLDETNIGDNTQAWKKFLVLDMGSDEAMSGGIKGVHCAVGTANHAGSTLLKHWLQPAWESPFEASMKARDGVSFVPSDHIDDGSQFYSTVTPNSSPNNAIEAGSWLPDPHGFSPEAPRLAEQCKHVDGTTLVNMPNPELSWLTWRVPENAVSIGRLLICHSRNKLAEDIFDTRNVRFHYAVSDAMGDWKVIEDTQKNENKGDQCTVIVEEMEENDRIAAGLYGVWVAVEWKKEGIFNFDYLVAM